MANNDGRVIINIDSNAQKVAKDFENLSNDTTKYERVLRNVAGTSNSTLPVYDKIRTKLKEQQQAANNAVTAYQKLTNVQQSGIGFNQLNTVTGSAIERLKNLALQGRQNSTEFQKLASVVKNANKQLNSADNVVNKAIGNTQGLASSFLNLNTALGALSIGYITNKIIDLGKSAVDTSMDFQALENRMNAAAGNKSVGFDSLDYIREQADKLGLEFRTTADSFAGFEAAALRSGLTLEQTKQIFTDVSTAATSMQLSTERVQLVFKALEQISGKGTVSMEELRQQLGDSLPGAFEIAAQSMGMTTRAFYDAVANGEVLSSEFLPKFAKAIKEQLGGSAEEASTQLRASLNRLNTDLMDSSNAWGTLLQPSVQKGVEALRDAAQASTTLANTLKFSPEITSTATAITAATTAAIGLSTALRTIPPILLAVRNGITAINLTSLLNPIGLISTAIGGVTYALIRNKLAIDDAKRSTDLFKESLDQETSEAVRQLNEYGRLITVKNKTNSQVERLKDLTEELTAKYPKYIDKLKQELILKGKISRATAEQIANEITLAKVKELQEKKNKIDEQVTKQQRTYKMNNAIAAARFDIPIDTTKGRQGVRKYLQIQQDELAKQLKLTEKNRKKIINDLTFDINDYTLGNSTGDLGNNKDKKGREKRQLTISEQLQKSYNDEFRTLQDLAAQGITSGKIWDSQATKVNNLSAALERVKQATDLTVLPPFQALNSEIQKAQDKVNNLAAAKIVNLEELKKAKGELTDLQKRLQDVQDAATISPYQQKQNRLSNLQAQLRDMAASGLTGTTGFNQLKTAVREAENEIRRINADVTNAVGLSWSSVSSTISSQLSYALTTPLQEGENAFERFGNVAINVIQQIAQAWLSSKLTSLFEKSGSNKSGGLFGKLGGLIGSIWGPAGSVAGGVAGGAVDKVVASANGNVFRNGNVIPFAKGGVVSSPSMFPMAGNRTGLMGERGAEAIMPLKRAANGQLGVQAQATPANVNIYNQSDTRIETVQRPNGDTDIFIKRINNALRSERTQSGFSSALQRNQSRGVQAS